MPASWPSDFIEVSELQQSDNRLNWIKTKIADELAANFMEENKDILSTDLSKQASIDKRLDKQKEKKLAAIKQTLDQYISQWKPLPIKFKPNIQKTIENFALDDLDISQTIRDAGKPTSVEQLFEYCEKQKAQLATGEKDQQLAKLQDDLNKSEVNKKHIKNVVFRPISRINFIPKDRQARYRRKITWLRSRYIKKHFPQSEEISYKENPEQSVKYAETLMKRLSRSFKATQWWITRSTLMSSGDILWNIWAWLYQRVTFWKQHKKKWYPFTQIEHAIKKIEEELKTDDTWFRGTEAAYILEELKSVVWVLLESQKAIDKENKQIDGRAAMENFATGTSQV